MLKRFYLFIYLERGEGKEKERERKIDQLPLEHPPTREPGLQAKYVKLGIKLGTFRFMGPSPTH